LENDDETVLNSPFVVAGALLREAALNSAYSAGDPGLKPLRRITVSNRSYTHSEVPNR
jgi:hypothetical protein